MKRFAVILGSLMLVATLVYPVIAWGPRWGHGGHHMIDSWGYGKGYGPESYDARYGGQYPEQTGLDQQGRETGPKGDYGAGYGGDRGRYIKDYGYRMGGGGPMGCWN